MKEKKQSLLRTIAHILWSIFLSGLFTILPLTLTIGLFSFSFKLLKTWLQPIQNTINKTSLAYVPHSEIFIILIIIFVVGIIMRNFILRNVVHSLESVIFRIPLIRPIYSGIKQLVDAFNFKEKMTFKQVVAIEFPRKGVYSIGFLTGQLPKEIAPHKDEQYFNIFVPTTPNPTTGYFLIVTDKEIIPIELTRQEAMALIISGGIILPDRFAK
jgi:uncharacterized membrane protein